MKRLLQHYKVQSCSISPLTFRWLSFCIGCRLGDCSCFDCRHYNEKKVIFKQDPEDRDIHVRKGVSWTIIELAFPSHRAGSC